MSSPSSSGRRRWIVLQVLLLHVVVLAPFLLTKNNPTNSNRQASYVHVKVDLLNSSQNTTNTNNNESDTTINSTGLPTNNTTTTNNSTGGLNVVLFYADDWAADVLGIVNDRVHTPHLDALAKEGQWFPHNYVTSSVCWQSRATLITGMYVAVHKFVQLSSMILFETGLWNQTLPYLLRNVGGYHVGFVGKWHMGSPREFMNQAFDFWRLASGAHWLERDGTTRHITELNQADALEFLRNRPRDQKFALTVSFYATHSWNKKPWPEIYSPQNYTQELYAAEEFLPRPVTATEQAWEGLPNFFQESSQARRNFHARGFDTEAKRQVTMKNIFRMAKEVDDAVGQVIQELKEQGVYNNTLLVFTADNGNYMGEFGLAGKWYTHDQSIRVPLIIRDPRATERQPATVQPHDEIALSIDLAPTILSAANITPPTAMQGRDLAALYLEEHPEKDIPFREDFFYEWNLGNTPDGLNHSYGIHRNPAVFGLIQKEWKYVFWPQADLEQIFNLTEDPTEQTSMLPNANNTDKYLQLKDRYNHLKWMSQRGDKIW